MHAISAMGSHENGCAGSGCASSDCEPPSAKRPLRAFTSKPKREATLIASARGCENVNTAFVVVINCVLPAS
jgi:hypothetical protein